MLTKEFTAECKKKLTGDRDRLEKELKGLAGDDFGHDVDDGEEKAEETEQIENDEGAAAEYSARLVDIDSALGKIDDGTYGECENCHKEISEKILKIDPESRLCGDCKNALLTK
jgi:RNA polymerase-binding transcription factor DksA